MQKEAVDLSSRFIKTVHSARVVYRNSAVCKGGLLKQLGECWQWHAAYCPTFQHKYASSKYTVFAPNTLTRCERLGILHLPKVFAQIHSLQNNDYFFCPGSVLGKPGMFSISSRCTSRKWICMQGILVYKVTNDRC